MKINKIMFSILMVIVMASTVNTSTAYNITQSTAGSAGARSGDWTPPTLISSLISPDPTSGDIQFSYDASDNVDLGSVKLYVESPTSPGLYTEQVNQIATGSNDTGLITFSTLDGPGTYNFYLISEDWFGNFSTTPILPQYSTLFDDTRASVDMLPKGTQFTDSNTTYPISLTATEDVTFIDNIVYRVRQYDNNDCSGNLTIVTSNTPMSVTTAPLSDSLIEEASADVDLSVLAEGCYRINTRTTNTVGLNAFRNFNLVIDRTAPVANAGSNQTINLLLPDLGQVYFNATTTADNIDEIGDLTFDWDWEDDGTFDAIDAGPGPTHIYATDGIYDVRVRVTDRTGNFSESTVQITVLP